MPKLTDTATEIGSSAAGAIVLHKTAFQTRHDILHDTKMAKAGVETIDRIKNHNALRRGTHMEPAVASWAHEVLEDMVKGKIDMWEPRDSFRRPDLRIASSVDRVINLHHNQLILTNKMQVTYTFEGEGICEVKTDYYHQGKPKPEWIFQVLHQLVCTSLGWGIIVCADQKGKLNIYPVPKDERLIEVMLKAYQEFWELVDTDGEYPPIADNDDIKPVDITERLPETNSDLAQMCRDYLTAAAEESKWKKLKGEQKEGIVYALDALGVEHAELPGFVIKSVTVTKPRKQMVETDEMIESHSFTLKEVSCE